MKWIGHFEFGGNFKPINFNNWLARKPYPYLTDENFWLEYWIEAYSYILKNNTSNTYFIDFDKLLSNKQASMSKIADIARLKDKNRFINFAATLREPTSTAIPMERCSTALIKKAQELYEHLQTIAI
jgi:hypothetical protein